MATVKSRQNDACLHAARFCFSPLIQPGTLIQGIAPAAVDWVFLCQLTKSKTSPTDLSPGQPDQDNPSLRLLPPGKFIDCVKVMIKLSDTYSSQQFGDHNHHIGYPVVPALSGIEGRRSDSPSCLESFSSSQDTDRHRTQCSWLRHWGRVPCCMQQEHFIWLGLRTPRTEKSEPGFLANVSQSLGLAWSCRDGVCCVVVVNI